MPPLVNERCQTRRRFLIRRTPRLRSCAARTEPETAVEPLRRSGLVGHSRGGGETLQYLLAFEDVQAAVLHAAGHGSGR